MSTSSVVTPGAEKHRSMLGRIINTGRWFYILSYSFYVLLHLFLADVGVERYVPSYLPFPYFWNYMTGIAILAFIVSGISGKYDKLAALLMALYVLLVAILVHAPNAAGDPEELLNVFRLANMIGGALMYAGAFAKDKRLTGG